MRSHKAFGLHCYAYGLTLMQCAILWLSSDAFGGVDDTQFDIWYGTHQRFGHLGVPQRWINILGNVSDPDGIDWLSYSLNGGSEHALSIGADRRRLLQAGDFNVEIDRIEFQPGLNEVAIIAIDTSGNRTEQIVTVDFSDGITWPENYSID